MYAPIRDYAIIGNLRSAVLVSKNGSIDWAPAPFIDSPSVFGALLDDEKGGRWFIRPAERYTSRQRYDGNTNVIITEFHTDSGSVEITDFIPIEKEKTFVPAEEDQTFRIHRKVSCARGTCELIMRFEPRFDYGRGTTSLTRIPDGILAENGSLRGILETTRPCAIDDNTARATYTMTAGEIEFFIFRYNVREIDRSKNTGQSETRLDETRHFWNTWAHNCNISSYNMPAHWCDVVVRSSLVLKILFFEPVGTIAAAATTSLPESIGGERNWDYRFTWLRDSAMTLSALYKLGNVREAEEYVRWIIKTYRAAITNPSESLQIMYGLRGETELEEAVLEHLSGYENSRPVRIGNGAYNQKQWDIYGNIFDMVWTIHNLWDNHELKDETWTMLRDIANLVTHIWQEPDEGLWETRGGKQHFVYSKVMCWVALDRAQKIANAHNLEGETERWKETQNAIREAVLSRGWNEERQSFTQSFGSDALDASLLTLPALGFIDGSDPKMLSTIDAILRELGIGGEGLLRRYTSPDGISGGEGAFLLASFWLVDALVLASRREHAEKVFEYILGLTNHIGLFSEEIDPVTKAFLGNFPQAYTHIGLINSAFNLSNSA